MYKWVQEPGVVARFTKGRQGKLISTDDIGRYCVHVSAKVDASSCA